MCKNPEKDKCLRRDNGVWFADLLNYDELRDVDIQWSSSSDVKKFLVKKFKLKCSKKEKGQEFVETASIDAIRTYLRTKYDDMWMSRHATWVKWIINESIIQESRHKFEWAK